MALGFQVYIKKNCWKKKSSFGFTNFLGLTNPNRRNSDTLCNEPPCWFHGAACPVGKPRVSWRFFCVWEIIILQKTLSLKSLVKNLFLNTVVYTREFIFFWTTFEIWWFETYKIDDCFNCCMESFDVPYWWIIHFYLWEIIEWNCPGVFDKCCCGWSHVWLEWLLGKMQLRHVVQLCCCTL